MPSSLSMWLFTMIGAQFSSASRFHVSGIPDAIHLWSPDSRNVNISEHQINGPQSPNSDGSTLLFTYRDFMISRIVNSTVFSPLFARSLKCRYLWASTWWLMTLFNWRLWSSRDFTFHGFGGLLTSVLPISEIAMVLDRRSRYLLWSTTVINSGLHVSRLWILWSPFDT